MARSISTQGYSVLKSSLKQEDIDAIKKELTVSPNIPQDYTMGEPPSFKLYQEGPNKLYMPKFYGIKRFGDPDTSKLEVGEDINIEFQGGLRKEQEEPVRRFLAATKEPFASGGLLNLTCASGKCLGKNTRVLMHSGEVKMVQDVVPGDMLMGDDSLPRTVLSTCTGREKMYLVRQSVGDSYVVNSSHILTLCHGDHLVDIPIEKYLAHPQKNNMLGVKAPASFPSRPVTNDPYTAGIEFGAGLAAPVPIEYRANSADVMLKFLWGVMKACPTRPAERLAKTVEDMCTSLGLAPWFSTNGGPKLSPIGVGGKRCFVYPISVEELEEDEYYGFEIDGNHRFLLGDLTVTHNTVMAIYLICQMKKKSLVIVHKDFLLQQWKERIEQFAPGARLGLIKAKTIDVEDKDIVLASLQSLSMKDYEKDIFKGFGLVVIDEVHHTSAEVFSKALRKVAFKYTLGLSATIKRKDGLSKVFKWYLGDVIYSNVKKKQEDTVDIDLQYYYVPDPRYSKEEYMMGKKLNISKMINNICEYQPRIDFVVSAIKEALRKEPLRRPIVLSDRRNHLERIGDALRKAGIDCGYYFGGMRQEDLKESETKRVLLGTFCMVSEGFDCKSLDTLVIASPKSDVVQSVGRILREEAKNRRHTPLVIDIIDQFSIFERQANKRIQYYKSQRYNIAGEPPQRDSKPVKLEGCCFKDLE